MRLAPARPRRQRSLPVGGSPRRAPPRHRRIQHLTENPLPPNTPGQARAATGEPLGDPAVLRDARTAATRGRGAPLYTPPQSNLQQRSAGPQAYRPQAGALERGGGWGYADRGAARASTRELARKSRPFSLHGPGPRWGKLLGDGERGGRPSRGPASARRIDLSLVGPHPTANPGAAPDR